MACFGVEYMLSDAGVEDTPDSRKAVDILLAVSGGKEVPAMCSLRTICQEARDPVYGPRVVGTIQQRHHIPMDMKTVHKIQDLCGLKASREAHEAKKRNRKQLQVDFTKSALERCRQIHRSLELLDPPLEPVLRAHLATKRALLTNVQKPSDCLQVCEFLASIDGALDSSLEAQKLCGRAAYLAWAEACQAVQAPVDEEWCGGPDGPGRESSDEEEDWDEYGGSGRRCGAQQVQHRLWDRVTVVDLVSKPEFNGKMGVLIGRQPGSERWQLRLAGPGGQEVALKPSNLRPPPRPTRFQRALESLVNAMRLRAEMMREHGNEQVPTPSGLGLSGRLGSFRRGLPWDLWGSEELAPLPASPTAVQHSLSADQVPPELVCPLTHEVLRDPVQLVGDGMTYERESIERWFGGGERRSPMTNEIMDNVTVVPNQLARAMLLRLSSQN